MKIKPLHPDFKDFPEIDFTGRLNKMVTYENSYEELLQGMLNPYFRKNMGDSAVEEIYVRAYNYTATMFAGYNRLAYICVMYAEEVKRCFLHEVENQRIKAGSLKPVKEDKNNAGWYKEDFPADGGKTGV